MANPLAWGLEALQKVGTKAAGKGKMIWKTLGGEGTEEVAEKIGKETGEKLAAIDTKQASRRSVAKKYRTSINEARRGTGEAAQEAINKGTNRGTRTEDGGISFVGDDGVKYERTKNPNWKEGDVRKSSTNPNGRNQWLYTADGQSINGQRFGQAQASFKQNGGVFGAADEEVASGFLNTAKNVWDGIPGWAKTAGIATAGGIAGIALFGDDDDSYYDMTVDTNY